MSLRSVIEYLPHLSALALSGCWKLTDAGQVQLAEPTINSTLKNMDITVYKVTDLCLERVAGCSSLVRVDYTGKQILQFVQNSAYKLKVYGQIIFKIRDVAEGSI